MNDIRQQIEQILEYNVGNEISDEDHKDIANDLLALISQTVSSEQAKLLNRLASQAREYGVPDVEMIERNGDFLNAVPLTAIEAESTRLLGRET